MHWFSATPIEHFSYVHDWTLIKFSTPTVCRGKNRSPNLLATITTSKHVLPFICDQGSAWLKIITWIQLIPLDSMIDRTMDYDHKQWRFSTEGRNYRKHYWFQTWVFRKMQYSSFSNLSQTDPWRSIQLNTCTSFVTYYTLWTKCHNCKDSILVPRGCDPFGQRHGSRPLANTAVKWVRMYKPPACDFGARGNGLHNFHRNKWASKWRQI